LKTNTETKDYSSIKLAVVCREVDPASGSISVYLCEMTTLEKVMITSLQWRQRYNWNLKYFFIEKSNYDNESTRDYLFDLIKNEKKSSMIINVEEI
jgi:hypothetical protein